MTITPKGKSNFAQSMVDDGRTSYRRKQTFRRFDIHQAIRDIKRRPEPLYKEGDTILLADGTRRHIIYRTYSEVKKSWQYRMSTNIPNRWGGTCQSPLYTEQELINMTQAHQIIQPAFALGDLLILPTGFEREVKYITQPKSGEFRYWFYIQEKQMVDYTEQQLKEASVESKIDELPSFYAEPTRKQIIKVVEVPTLPFYPETLVSLIESDTNDTIMAEKDARIAALEAEVLKANRKLKLIQHKEMQYKNLRKNQSTLLKTILEIAPNKYTSIAESLLETVEYDKMGSPTLADNEALKIQVAALEGQVAIYERRIERLLDVLTDIREAATKQSGDNLNSLWGWIGFMASMGINGGYYSDNIKQRFDNLPSENQPTIYEKDKI